MNWKYKGSTARLLGMKWKKGGLLQDLYRLKKNRINFFLFQTTEEFVSKKPLLVAWVTKTISLSVWNALKCSIVTF